MHNNQVYFRLLYIILAFSTVSCSASQPANENLYIRVNQVGYYPDNTKQAVIFAEKPLKTKEFSLFDKNTGKEVFTGTFSENLGAWGNFGFHYHADFTNFSAAGVYVLQAGGKRSPEFSIANNIYNTLPDSLLEFYKMQRCGPTNPKYHKVCHIYDSPQVVGDTKAGGIDVTGGWHDAGDYIKFLNTSAYTTYMLLLSYQLNKPAAEFDRDNNGAPDILEEAKVGLDWLLRCNYSGTKLVTQVQDNRDHEQGFRMPENDSLKFDRPAYVGAGKSIVGLYSAALALGAQVWRERFHDEAVANKMLQIAEKIYGIRNSVPNVDVTNSGMYSDKNYLGKLALGAIELYNATGKGLYLQEAKDYSQKAKSDYWWSWGDMNSLAHFRIAKYAPGNLEFITNNLVHFNTYRNKSIYGEGAAYTWGTTNTLMGCALQAVFYKILTGRQEYDSLITSQVDYVFGKNPWGVSFFYNFGTESVRHLHSQVAYFNGGYIPGGISAGPAPKSALQGMQIKREYSKLDKFNSSDVLFFDDRNDYITNEPTIVTNATALFLFLYLNQNGIK